tara:strand:- start:2111 stop:2422 length:312 start_codon:yes stop_codon:yes gene_type:complete
MGGRGVVVAKHAIQRYIEKVKNVGEKQAEENIISAVENAKDWAENGSRRYAVVGRPRMCVVMSKGDIPAVCTVYSVSGNSHASTYHIRKAKKEAGLVFIDRRL